MKKTHPLIICFAISLFSFTPQTALADPDCDGDQVSLGEVMAGLEAGFTAAGLNSISSASEFYNAASGVDTRGFINPEGQSGFACEGDWFVVFSWLGISAGFQGLHTGEIFEITNNFVQTRILVDGVEYESLETNAKWGFLPLVFGGSRAAMKNWGVIFEPHELATGLYTAELVWRFDWDCLPFIVGGSGACDGDYETDVGSVLYEFEVLPE